MHPVATPKARVLLALISSLSCTRITNMRFRRLTSVSNNGDKNRLILTSSIDFMTWLKSIWPQIMNSSINKVELLHDFSKITIWLSFTSKILHISRYVWYRIKGVLHLWALFLKTLCIFSKKKSNFGQSILWSWSEMFQGTQKSQFYFSRHHCCEVTVKNKRKSILSMFWSINQ